MTTRPVDPVDDQPAEIRAAFGHEVDPVRSPFDDDPDRPAPWGAMIWATAIPVPRTVILTLLVHAVTEFLVPII